MVHGTVYCNLFIWFNNENFLSQLILSYRKKTPWKSVYFFTGPMSCINFYICCEQEIKTALKFKDVAILPVLFDMSSPLFSIAFKSTLKLLPKETEVHCITSCILLPVVFLFQLEQEKVPFPISSWYKCVRLELWYFCLRYLGVF